jgi:hypothetical protein
MGNLVHPSIPNPVASLRHHGFRRPASTSLARGARRAPGTRRAHRRPRGGARRCLGTSSSLHSTRCLCRRGDLGALGRRR